MNKIIFITNYFGNGGAARVMSILTNKFVDDDIEVEIISFLEKDNIYKLNPKVKFIELNSKKTKMSKLKRIIKLRKILRKNKNATIISFEYFVNMQTIIANFFLKNKLVVSERNDPARVGNKWKLIRNFLYLFADKFVFQTTDAKNYFPKCIQKKSVVIPNPIMENLPQKYDGERKKNIINFCRIERQKNIKLLIDAFNMVNQEYQDYKLLIYGNGSEKENLIKYASKNKNIIFYDFEDNLHQKILDSSMFVSTSDYEGISNSMLEAMAIGLPTVCTDCPCGGARMMIENEKNGVLVPVGDLNAVYSAMKKIISDSAFSKKISNNAVKIRDKLDSKKIIKLWLDVINK